MASIMITGASSGIGKALALEYAEQGTILFLCARRKERLEETASKCQKKGATVYTRCLDVTDEKAMKEWIAEAESMSCLDIVIANAGISAGTGSLDGESEAKTREIFAINLGGVMNTVLPLIPIFQKRKCGQIILISSLAGYRGVPGAPAYSGSKGAVRIWGEALRGWLKSYGIKVSVVCPGFVESEITAKNKFPMPGLMKADKAAGIIRSGAERNKPRITFPFYMAFISWLMMALPVAVSDFIYSRLPLKE
ncbi:MAG: SDR family NAD(P)-dependent oxidoreductase [Alphaproteobacteria bacterium]|nr:SDR family NAD(P)-dependent oxidoreductase [Alphaproteobacteria bacterium]